MPDASDSRRGVRGQSATLQGVYGQSSSQAGAAGESHTFDGVVDMSHDRQRADVSGHNDKGGMGGFFDALVQIDADATVTGKLTAGGDIILSGADGAEEFAIDL